MLTIAIIGAGPLGRRLALACACAGVRVLLEDVMPANLHHAREYIRAQFGAPALDHDYSPIQFVSTIEDAVRDADLAIDCVPDELESKLEILWLLDRMAPPRTVLATPTRQLSITDLAACTYRPDKCVAIAAEARDLAETPASPILLRATSRTSAETVALLRSFWQQLGFTPRFEMEPASSSATPAEPAQPTN